MIKLIIFDYDGVIADSFPLRYAIFKRICPALGKRCPPTMEGLKGIWGDHAGETLKRLGCSPDEIARGTNRFKEELDRAAVPLFAGIQQVLETLAQSHVLVLLTANKESRIKTHLKDNDLEKYFTKIVGNETLFTAEFKIKKEEKIVALLKEMRANPHETLFIADRDIDRRDARQAGIPDGHIILTDYGYGHTKRQLWRIDTPEHILRVIREIETEPSRRTQQNGREQ